MPHGKIPLSVIAALLVIATSQFAGSQTFTILHTFSGGGDGADPNGIIMDNFGSIYGTTYGGGTGVGTVFKLKHMGSGWILSTLYAFQGTNDGSNPEATVVIGPSNILYGTTYLGGESGHGTVFSLRPPLTVCVAIRCPWTHTVLHSFTGADGSTPQYAELVFDPQGNIYGTTNSGGENNGGVVYELTPSGGGWTESVVHSFASNESSSPFSGVIFDSAGNLYGANSAGGAHDHGAVYELVKSGSNWTYNELYAFTDQADGETPEGGVIFDSLGNLFSTTALGGSGGGGSAFELSPSGGGWLINVLQDLSGLPGPLAGLTMDAAENLYGTSFTGGTSGYGYVFKLTRSGNGWTYSTLYNFTGGADGGNPLGNVILDASGNIYGASSCSFRGCQVGAGAIWEISP